MSVALYDELTENPNGNYANRLLEDVATGYRYEIRGVVGCKGNVCGVQIIHLDYHNDLDFVAFNCKAFKNLFLV
jgi:hypothetical protein